MTLFLFLVWLQMSAQPRHVIDDNPPCQSAKLYYGGVLVDEEPHCGPLLQVINMPTALDDITRVEFAEAAQRAADETDGKPRQNMPPLPPSGSMQCWNDSQTSDYLCQDSKGRTVDVTKALIRLMESDVDVPAVQETRTYKSGFAKSCKSAPECKNWPKDAGVCNIAICEDDTATETITTCADKSRILEHDENSPPKYWCRKVQP